jgi:hypothetical protein
MIARKVERLVGTIDYYTMDEPLFFGHVFTEPPRIGLQGVVDAIYQLAT